MKWYRGEPGHLRLRNALTLSERWVHTVDADNKPTCLFVQPLGAAAVIANTAFWQRAQGSRRDNAVMAYDAN